MNISLYINKSKIHGNGLFTKNKIKKDTEILLVGDLERYYSGVTWITKLGRLINHQKNGNTYINKKGILFFLYANRDIMPNEELTSDYTVLSKPFINEIKGYKEL